MNTLLHIWEYGFFDDNYTLAQKGYHGEDKLSLYQFLVMGGLFIIIVIGSCFLRKVSKQRVNILYKILAVFMIAAEIAKMTFSTYFDMIHGEPFNWGGILPFYTCSMCLFLLPILAWGKGKARDCAAAWFCTIGLVAGVSNFIYLSGAGFYPILSYGGLYSVFYHTNIVFVGMSLMITGAYKVTWRSIIDAMIPIIIFGLIVIPINFAIFYLAGQGYVDYMLLMDANGFVPFLTDWFKQNNLQWLFSFFALFIVYPAATALITAIDIGFRKVFEGFSRPKAKTAQ